MFKIQDPQGNIITLTQECWNDHICINHTEMRHLLTEIKNTIVNPDYIYQSKSSNKTHLYFKEYRNPGLNCNYLLVVIYRRPNLRKEYVQSAYPVKTLSKGGELEWQRT
ncbi:MAG: hypothetical protein QME42_03555 [bacterium]|nr:hypothetical protein [bacterium]